MSETATTPKNSSLKKYLLIAAALIIVGGVVLQQVLRKTEESSLGAMPEEGAPLVSPEVGSSKVEKISVKGDTKGWQEYRNEKQGFSVKYPADFNLRGRVDSDVAILEFPLKGSGDQKALITLSRKTKPRNEGEFASVEEMWASEEPFIQAQSGEVKRTRWIELNKRKFFEVEEDNRLTNFMALHRYAQEGGKVFEVTLTIAGEKFNDEKTNIYNQMLMTFTAK